MTEDNLTIVIAALAGGGFLSAIVALITHFRKYPIDRKSAKIEHSKATVEMALSTLEAVNAQYQEVLKRQVLMEKELENLKDMFEVERKFSSALKDYIIHIFSAWESIRQKPNPPKLPDDINDTIFKDE